MIAVDSGFLYALADRSDAWHHRCVAQLGTVAEGWVTTWPVLAEATHLLVRRLGVAPAISLMEDVAAARMAVWDVPAAHVHALGTLMRKYDRLPMDLADATLVMLAEHLGHGRILTVDVRDFDTYRWKSREPFVNLMAP